MIRRAANCVLELKHTAFAGFAAGPRQIVGKPDSYGLRPEADRGQPPA